MKLRLVVELHGRLATDNGSLITRMAVAVAVDVVAVVAVVVVVVVTQDVAKVATTLVKVTMVMVKTTTPVDVLWPAVIVTNLGIMRPSVGVRLATKLKPSKLKLMRRFVQLGWLRVHRFLAVEPFLELLRPLELTRHLIPHHRLWRCLALIDNLGTLPQQLLMTIVEVPTTRPL